MTYTPEQQKQNRNKWIAALRSGDYRQATGSLRLNDSFCCLGVACDISGLGTWIDHDTFRVSGRGDMALGCLPPAVAQWLGLHSATGEFNDAESLAHYNDDGASFEEIAQMIEDRESELINHLDYEELDRRRKAIVC